MTKDTVELRGGKYVVLSGAGEVLGEFDTEAEANERLRQIEAGKGDSDAPRVEAGVRRYDRGTLRKKPRYDDQTGFLHVEMSVTKAPAVFTYKNADGTLRREFRDPKHVFSADNVERMRNSVITLDHPPVKVTTRNVKRFSVGSADGSKSVEDAHFWTGGIIRDDDAIASLKGGKAQTSAGYDCDVVFQPGVWVDAAGAKHPYDAVQTNHRHNHTALVDFGRAETTGVSLDRMDAVQVAEGDNMAEKDKDGADSRREDSLLSSGDDKTKGTVKIDGIDVEMPIETAKLVANEQRKAKADADKLEAERDTAKAALDTATEKLKNTSTEEEITARVDAKRELLDKASAFIDDQAEFDAIKAKSDDEIKRACIAKANPDAKLDGKSETYVDVMFDMLEPHREDNMSRAGRALLGARSQDADAGRDILVKRINVSIDKTDNAFRRAIPGGMTVDGKTGAGEQLHG